MNDHHPALATANQVATRFGVSVTTVNSWVREGRIPCIRPSRRVVRFDLDAVEQAIARPAKEPTPVSNSFSVPEVTPS